MHNIDPNTEKAVHRFMGLIPSRFSVARAILFGSRARGTHDSDSDADLAIVLNGKPQPVLKTSLDLADLAFSPQYPSGLMNGSTRKPTQTRCYLQTSRKMECAFHD
jgi:predicted nucleotidyltransferase